MLGPPSHCEETQSLLAVLGVLRKKHSFESSCMKEGPRSRRRQLDKARCACSLTGGTGQGLVQGRVRVCCTCKGVPGNTRSGGYGQTASGAWLGWLRLCYSAKHEAPEVEERQWNSFKEKETRFRGGGVGGTSVDTGGGGNGHMSCASSLPASIYPFMPTGQPSAPSWNNLESDLNL